MSGLFDLDGRVAAVIGGTGVLGGVICQGLADAGAWVAVLGRSCERGEERAAALTGGGGRAAAIIVDAMSPGSIEAARREVEARLGPVDILVNAPGVNSSPPFFEIDLDEWHRVLDTNLTSVFLASQVFGRAMVERGQGGTIIDISSTSDSAPTIEGAAPLEDPAGPPGRGRGASEHGSIEQLPTDGNRPAVAENAPGQLGANRRHEVLDRCRRSGRMPRNGWAIRPVHRVEGLPVGPRQPALDRSQPDAEPASHRSLGGTLANRRDDRAMLPLATPDAVRDAAGEAGRGRSIPVLHAERPRHARHPFESSSRGAAWAWSGVPPPGCLRSRERCRRHAGISWSSRPGRCGDGIRGPWSAWTRTPQSAVGACAAGGGFRALHLAGTPATGQQPRTLSDIVRIINGARLPDLLAERAVDVFRRLVDAEARGHGQPVGAVVLHEAGDDDASSTSHGRLAVTMSALVAEQEAHRVKVTFFRTTTTLGVRHYPVTRSVLDREVDSVDIRGATVRIKRGRLGGRVVTSMPEHADLEGLARQTGATVRELWSESVQALPSTSREPDLERPTAARKFG